MEIFCALLVDWHPILLKLIKSHMRHVYIFFWFCDMFWIWIPMTNWKTLNPKRHFCTYQPFLQFTIFIVPHDNQSITIGYSCTINYIKIAIIVVWFFLFNTIFKPNFDIVKSNCRFSRCSLNLVFSIFKFFGFNFNTFFQIQEPQSLFKNGSNSMYTLPHSQMLEIIRYKSLHQIKIKV
jgi:hypothetical protein